MVTKITYDLYQLALLPQRALATIYDGPGVEEGVNRAAEVSGVSGRTFREVVLDILQTVVSFMGLAAVVVIVIAGIILVVGLGTDESREKAKKIILYAIIGLIVILLARAIVEFVKTIESSTVP
jgi:type IV secretory pathway VirB2 component (pilin)